LEAVQEGRHEVPQLDERRQVPEGASGVGSHLVVVLAGGYHRLDGLARDLPPRGVPQRIALAFEIRRRRRRALLSRRQLPLRYQHLAEVGQRPTGTRL
jgi:hypothetical protein